MCQKDRSGRQQARVVISVQALHSTEGQVSFITQGLSHLEKELGTSGNASCGVHIVQSEHPRRIPKATGWLASLEKPPKPGLLVLTVLWGIGHLIISSAPSEAGHLDIQVKFLGR